MPFFIFDLPFLPQSSPEHKKNSSPPLFPHHSHEPLQHNGPLPGKQGESVARQEPRNDVDEATGKFDGRDVGDRVGRAVGERVGHKVGVRVGRRIGDCVGRVDGGDVGLAKGERVGFLDGFDVGCFDGDLVGCPGESVRGLPCSSIVKTGSPVGGAVVG